MYNNANFYRDYFCDHYYYKSTTLKRIIDDFPKFKLLLFGESVDDIEEKVYLFGLKAELRATYFQAIESLFELLFALLPDKDKFYDLEAWLRLSSSDYRRNFKCIERIAKGDMEQFDEQITVKLDDGSNKRMSKLEYLIYFDLIDEKYTERKQESMAAIRLALRLIAQDFSDRDEYNAIKHGIRIFPVMSQLAIGAAGSNEFKIKLDLTNSMSLMKKDGELSTTIVTAPLDHDRDERMAHLCSALISNLIRTRRRRLTKSDEKLNIYFLTMDDVNRMNHSDFSWGKFAITSSIVQPDETN